MVMVKWIMVDNGNMEYEWIWMVFPLSTIIHHNEFQNYNDHGE